MQDNDCVRFLKWALPQLQMRWAGFRKVRKQVCKRLEHRLSELSLANIDTYANFLTQQQDEWQHLDRLCRVVVTRFYRDKRVFAELTTRILPQLAANALRQGRLRLRIWSIGSASGEEPYTLAIVWDQFLAPNYPQIQLLIVATEIEPNLIERSRRACYTLGTLKNLPYELCAAAFTVINGQYHLKSQYQEMVEFRLQDIRTALPDESFDLILCRNLVFTYFDESQQRIIFQRVLSRLLPDGWLVLGVHEKLPGDMHGLQVVSERMGLYQQRG